jgi:hypothetical protein
MCSSSDMVGVEFQIALTGIPSEGGPFLYHIHEQPIAADCGSTATDANVTGSVMSPGSRHARRLAAFC